MTNTHGDALRTALVCGAGGFIGGHLVNRLLAEGMWVRAVDLKYNEYSVSRADEFVIGDLRDQTFVARVIDQPFDEVYQLAADMGGAGYVFSGENDAKIVANSAIININVLEACRKLNVQRVFYSSSACIYPEDNQRNPENPNCEETSAYPANPDSEYGWEKLFSERLYQSFNRNYNMNCRIARFHNIFGPEGTWQGGKEKVPAALCRKIGEANSGDSIDVWGDGNQTRSFLYIDQCIEGVIRLLRSECDVPVNIGSDECISINDLAAMIIAYSSKDIRIHHVDGPQGVRGRNSDNRLILKKLGWAPCQDLSEGIFRTYDWILEQIRLQRGF